LAVRPIIRAASVVETAESNHPGLLSRRDSKSGKILGMAGLQFCFAVLDAEPFLQLFPKIKICSTYPNWLWQSTFSAKIDFCTGGDV
jgi:hypothetical protein